MKSILSVLALIASLSLIAGPAAWAADTDACLDPCFASNNSCQKDCATALHKETTQCAGDVGCNDTVDLNFSSCQKACTDIGKTCVQGCMNKPAAAAATTPSS